MEGFKRDYQPIVNHRDNVSLGGNEKCGAGQSSKILTQGLDPCEGDRSVRDHFFKGRHHQHLDIGRDGKGISE